MVGEVTHIKRLDTDERTLLAVKLEQRRAKFVSM
jgi:hypothetical protein